MTDTPKRPILTLKGKGAGAKPAPARPQQKPSKPKAPPPPKKPKGPSYTPPRKPVDPMALFWMVYRDSGRRPKVRHATLTEAQVEAQRIASACPGAHVWVIECRTVETHHAPPSGQEGAS